MGIIVLIIIVALLQRFIKWINNTDDSYKKIRKESEFNTRVIKAINSRPNSHNKVGALSIIDQVDNNGKLSLTGQND